MTTMRTTYSAEWGSDRIAVTADWAQATSQIEGIDGAQQVARFPGPLAALREALRLEARAEGIDAAEAAMLIDAAMLTAREGG